MSLFRCRSSWSTSLDDGDGQCGQNCLLVSSELTIDNFQELIVVGSFSGMLRIFKPTLGPNNVAQPSDMILEKQLGYPVLEIKSGILRSGMKNHQLAVMSTQCVAVYNLTISTSNSDLDLSCKLEFCFERPIPESVGTCWQIVVGKFGGEESKSGLASMGIVSSGGAFVVFEKEAREPFIIKLFSPESAPLLGSLVAYSSAKDSFLVLSPTWEIQMHKYSNLVKFPKDTNNRLPDWSVILMDPVISLEVVNNPVKGPGILVLGQRSLTYWQWSGVINFSRKLPYSPLCMHYHFAGESLMTLVACETLLLYCDGQLCWSSQLPAPVVCISTIKFQGIAGHLVLLSDSLDLQICYLGTEPAMFCTAPKKDTVRSNLSVDEMTEELNRINSRLKGVTSVAPTSQGDLKVSVVMVKRATRGAIRLSVAAPISLLSLAVMVSKPIEASPKTVSISSLCDSVEIPLTFTTNLDTIPPTNMDVDICSSYAKADGTPQIIQTSVTKLPLSMLLHPTREEAEGENYKVDFNFAGNYNETVRNFLPGLQSGGGVAHFSGSFGNLTVKCFPGDPSKCSLQSNSVALLSLVASSVLGTPGLLPTTHKSAEPLKWLLDLIDSLAEKRKELDDSMEELKSLTCWARQVQFALLTRYRDQTAALLNGMDSLLSEAFQDINQLSNKILDCKQELERLDRRLGCTLKLCCQLLTLSPHPPKVETLEAIEASVGPSLNHKNWVEHTSSSLEHVMQNMWSSSDGLTAFQRGLAVAKESQQPAKLKSILSKVFSALE